MFIERAGKSSFEVGDLFQSPGQSRFKESSNNLLATPFEEILKQN